MITGMPTIGVRFDMQKVGGGYYGAACWTVFWEAIAAEELCGAVLYEGDTAATLNGSEHVSCLAVQSMDPSVIEKVKTRLRNSEGFLKVCASPMFVEGSLCTSEPLLGSGRIDAAGNLVGDAMAARSSLGNVKRRQRATGTPDAVSNAPERQKPASARTRGLQRFATFADTVAYLKKSFIPREYKYKYWLTPEELCDIVESAADVADVQYEEYSCDKSEDMCRVQLFQKSLPESPERHRISFFGLFAFASESDARNFVQDYPSNPAYMRVLSELAGISGKIQVNFYGEDDRGDYAKERAISSSDLWPKLWARRQSFSKDIEEAKRREAEQGSRQEEEGRRKAEEERRTQVQARRNSSSECVMCGKTLGVLQRLIGRDRHGQCTEFKG